MADTPARSSSWKKRTAGLMLAALAVVSGLSAGSQTPPFSDVDQSHPHYQDIFYAAEQRWFQGYPDGTFLGPAGSGCGVYAGILEISPERVLLR